MLSKELKLDFEALLSQLINGKGYLHYGVWDGLDPENACLADVGRAQQQYFDMLVEHLPPAPARILDVGSGTGANAAELLSLGYQVECICPSPRLNALARAKLGERVIIHETTFEDFEPTSKFDAMIFAESFHYIRLADAVSKLGLMAPKRIVILDYFHRHKAASYQDLTRQSVGNVLWSLENKLNDYRIIVNRDMTSEIAPTFDVLERLNRLHVAPFVDQLRASFSKHSIQGWIGRWFVDRMYCSPLQSMKKAKSITFAEQYEYRLIVLESC